MFAHTSIADLILPSPHAIRRVSLASGSFLEVAPTARGTPAPHGLVADPSCLRRPTSARHALRSYLRASEIDRWQLIRQFAILLIVLAVVCAARERCPDDARRGRLSGRRGGVGANPLPPGRSCSSERRVLECATSDACCFFDAICFGQFTVRASHAGTLVGYRTTAPRQPQSGRNSSHRPSHRAILLAALLLVLATLTLAARCNVSASAPDAIVQLSPNSLRSRVGFDARAPAAYNSPIHYSTSQLRTSNIVLSSRLAKPRANNLPSDISIIDKSYSKSYGADRARRRRRKARSARSPAEGDKVVRDEHGGDRNDIDAHRIPAFTPVDWGNRTGQRRHLVHPTRRHPVSVDGNNAHATSPTTAIAHKQAAVPRLRGVTSETTAPPAVFGFASAPNNSAINNRSDVPVYESTFIVGQRQRGDTAEGASTDHNKDTPSSPPPDTRPMPPEDVYTKDLLRESGGLLVLVAACLVLTLALGLGLVTCALSHYRGGILDDSPDDAQTPTTAPMLSVVSAGATAGVGGMDRLRGRGAARDLTANREHQVRLHTVHTDIAINLPPSISLPDGEEHPFSSRLHLRDTEQESEIYQKCVRPPPNRTALESESPPPYRSSSAGLLGSIGGGSFGSSTDWSGGSAPLVVRCHSMSASSVSSTKRPDAAGSSSPKTDFIQKTVKILTGKKSQPSPAPTLPPVIVPTRTRRPPDQHPHLSHSCHSAHHQPEQQQNNSTSGAPNSNV